MAVSVTDSDFESKVINSDVPVVVDFWAEWCGPCKMVGPVIDQLSTDFANKADVFKLNVDENPDTSAKYGIMSVPTVLVFKKGEVVEQFVGVQSMSVYSNAIDKHI